MRQKTLSCGLSMIVGALVLLIVVGVTTIMIGCFGDFTPMTPSKATDGVEQPHWLTYDVPDQPGAAKVILTASATIDPSTGGLVSGLHVGSAVRISLDVPPQTDGSSFRKAKTIRMTIEKAGILVLDFAPDKTQFDPPPTLTIAGARPAGNALSLYWWDPEADQWVKLATPVNVSADGTIITHIPHFSRYGVAD